MEDREKEKLGHLREGETKYPDTRRLGAESLCAVKGS